MKEKLLRGRHALGLAARIIVSVIIIAVIIWKYDDLKHIDVARGHRSAQAVCLPPLRVWGVYLLKSIVFVVPASLIYIAVGMAFTPLTAVAINAVGILLEVCATYLFGIILGGPYVINKLEKDKIRRPNSRAARQRQALGDIRYPRAARIPDRSRQPLPRRGQDALPAVSSALARRDSAPSDTFHRPRRRHLRLYPDG